MTRREKRGIIIYTAILILCIIILIIGAIFDNHCETFLGILAIISGWVGLIICIYGMVYALIS